jgi:hypothetical protein
MRYLRHSIATLSIAIGLMASIHAVAAHHSGTMFDPARTETVTGTVKDGDEPSEWLLEMTSPSVLNCLGWTRTSFKPGDRVQANIHPLRDAEEHGGSLQKITSLETGKTFSANLREQENLTGD